MASALTRRGLVGGGTAALGLFGASSAAHAEVPDHARYVMAQEVQAFLASTGTPGVSVAIARNGRVEYAEGFGVSDLGGQFMTADHQFRIASLSKPITATAIMRLVERGELSVGDRLFGPNGLLEGRYGPTYPALHGITVAHLMSHTGGGWTNDGRDPTMTNPGVSQDEMIARTLAYAPLDAAPGSRQMYSNFGYCLLGRVIEQVTGENYETWVRREVLRPCGSQAMRIGSYQRGSREVAYVAASGGNPYGVDMAMLDANGGWIASPTELVRFLVKVDGYQSTADILRVDSSRYMATRPFPGADFGHGWTVNDRDNWWHTGILPGTSAFMCRTRSGFCFAALANTGGPGSNLPLLLDQMMWRLAGYVPGWNP
ncbi:serine hydrolase domain-containing protein [Brevundimonas sp.]|uniref:serine hydrolase domain-containing protein n=1 Tax=Brevundimonas sp. TaxID=1871086 RepID=UPI002ABB2D38|nr:serine hydrolase domain-containing protein [Brevundimonas sp.]MDZ4364010.1 serine hydrolase domain-containing protein [Brevundimonas sp.]